MVIQVTKIRQTNGNYGPEAKAAVIAFADVKVISSLNGSKVCFTINNYRILRYIDSGKMFVIPHQQEYTDSEGNPRRMTVAHGTWGDGRKTMEGAAFDAAVENIIIEGYTEIMEDEAEKETKTNEATA